MQINHGLACALLLGMFAGVVRGEELPVTASDSTEITQVACPEPALRPGRSHSLLMGESDLICRAECCHHSWLMCPVEVYVRTGPAFMVGDSELDDRLETGWAAEIGAKVYSYDPDYGAAWIGELGIDYLYNNSDDSTEIAFRSQPVTLQQLHRIYPRIAAGREWYGGETWRYVIGVDAGARFGHAHLKFNEGFHATDTIQGIFAGLHAGLMIPRCCYDLVLDTRLEWAHDWIEILDVDEELDQVKVLLSAGVRY